MLYLTPKVTNYLLFYPKTKMTYFEKKKTQLNETSINTMLKCLAKLQMDQEAGIRTNTTICIAKISPYFSKDVSYISFSCCIKLMGFFFFQR